MIGQANMRRLATAAVLGAMALVVLDAGMTTVALPTIARSLNISPASSILVASAYQLAVLMGLLPAAHVAERFGQRRLFVIGIVIFSTASTLVAFAPGYAALVAARFVQGLGGAAILALGISLLRFTLGIERLGSAISWNALNVALCAASGPAIGALILTCVGWRWMFLVSLPLGLIVIVASAALPKIEPRQAAIDLASILLHAAGAGLLFLACQGIMAAPGAAAGLVATSCVCFACLVRRERSKASPLVPLDLLRDAPFRLAVAASTCCFVAQSAGLLALPFYLQLDLSSSALSTGLILASWPIAVSLTSPWVGPVTERYDAGLVCGVGAVILASGLLAASLLPAHQGIAALALCTMACGIGFALFQVPNNRNLFLAAAPERSAAAGGMQGTARLSGQTAGAVLVALLFASPDHLASPRIAMGVAAAFALGAALISIRRPGLENSTSIVAKLGRSNA